MKVTFSWVFPIMKVQVYFFFYDLGSKYPNFSKSCFSCSHNVSYLKERTELSGRIKCGFFQRPFKNKLEFIF